MVDKNKNFGENIHNNFIEGLDYIWESRKYIFFAIFLFFFFICLGVLFPDLFEQKILELIKNLLLQTRDLKGFSLISFIATNNIKSSFFSMFFGIFLGIFSLGVIVINGFLIGFVANRAVMSEGLLVLWKLFPHGIFEIPAVLISAGIGIRLGFLFFNKKKIFKSILFMALLFISLSFFMSLFMIISSLLFSGSLTIDSYNALNSNSVFMFFYYLFIILFFVASFYFSLTIYSSKERKNLLQKYKTNIRKAINTFLFVVIPLLVIAGIIEGSLIILLG